jgi:hypothetical protein
MFDVWRLEHRSRTTLTLGPTDPLQVSAHGYISESGLLMVVERCDQEPATSQGRNRVRQSTTSFMSGGVATATPSLGRGRELSTARIREWRGGCLRVDESHDASELPRPIGLALENSGNLAAYRCRVARLLV